MPFQGLNVLNSQALDASGTRSFCLQYAKSRIYRCGFVRKLKIIFIDQILGHRHILSQVKNTSRGHSNRLDRLNKAQRVKSIHWAQSVCTNISKFRIFNGQKNSIFGLIESGDHVLWSTVATSSLLVSITVTVRVVTKEFDLGFNHSKPFIQIPRIHGVKCIVKFYPEIYQSSFDSST